jgi:single-stranded DNA-binding protein
MQKKVNPMRSIKVNSGQISGLITNIHPQQGGKFVEIRNDNYYWSGGDEKVISCQMMLYVPDTESTHDTLKQGDFIIANVRYESYDVQGNNSSTFKQNSLFVYSIDTYIPSEMVSNTADAPWYRISSNKFTLGGNVGNVEQKNGNNGAWSTVTIALNRSFKDESGNWQDADPVWARITINGSQMKTLPQKGDALIVDCELKTRPFEDKNQNQAMSYDFKFSRVLHHVKKTEMEAMKQGQGQGQGQGHQHGHTPVPQNPTGSQNVPQQSGANNRSAGQLRSQQPANRPSQYNQGQFEQ